MSKNIPGNWMSQGHSHGEWKLWTYPFPGFNIILVRWFCCWRHFAHAISFTASPRAALYFCNTGRPCHARAQIVKRIDKVFRNILIWHITKKEKQVSRNSFPEDRHLSRTLIYWNIYLLELPFDSHGIFILTLFYFYFKIIKVALFDM